MTRAKKPSMLPGTLDLIVLQLLDAQPTSGYDLAQRIQATSKDVLTVGRPGGRQDIPVRSASGYPTSQ